MKRTRVGAQFAVDKQVLKLRLSTLRLRVVLVLIGLGFALLAARAMQLQMFKTDDLQEFGERSYTQSIHLPASRGKILDRNGLVLASSLPARAIYVDPRRFSDASPQQVVDLAKALDMTAEQVRQRVEKGGRQFAYLKRQADVAQAQVVQDLKVPGVETLKEYKRHYPEGQISAHVVGFTDYDDRGKEGIELASEERLHGADGSRRVMRDRLGRVIGDIQTVREPVDGQDEWLSLDSHLQYLTFNALQEAVKENGAKAGSAVVLDVNSGEILAVANWPTYDPNDRSKVRFSDMRNRTVTDSFEPGSTMKPFTAALALELRKVTPNTIIETAPGRLKIGPDTIGDSHFLGTLTVEQVVQKSSNVGTAKIALEMEPRQMWEFLSAVGFGHTPDIVFPGAVAGRLRPYRKWRPVEQATISYGHGVSVSLLQLAQAYMIFARDGDLPPVTMRRRDERMPGVQIISEKTAHAVRKMLEMAVSPEGTSPKARVSGYRVAGKTGTSRKLEKGRYVKKYVSSFAGFAPVSDPRVLVAVAIDEPSNGKYYAGDVAGPLFSRITGDALRLLRITPDAPVAEIEVPGAGPVTNQ